MRAVAVLGCSSDRVVEKEGEEMTNEQALQLLIKRIEIFENIHFAINSVLGVLCIIFMAMLIWNIWKGRKK